MRPFGDGDRTGRADEGEVTECLGEVVDERTGQKRTKSTAAAAARAIVHFITASWIKQGGTTLSSRWREFWGWSHT